VTQRAASEPSSTTSPRRTFSSLRALPSNELVWAGALLIVGTLIARFRLPGVIRNTLWAEDGPVFLSDRLHRGPWASLFTIYDGYLHLIPRLLTDVAVAVAPLEGFALAAADLSFVCAGFVAALVFLLSREFVPNTTLRLLLASTTFLLPALPVEVLGNLANLHWYFLWLAPWLFLYRPKSWRAATVLGVIGLLMALTEIQMVLFAPLALVNLKERKANLVAALTAGGLLAQIVCTLLAPRQRFDVGRPSPIDVLHGYVQLPVLSTFEGHIARVGAFVADAGGVSWLVLVGVGLTVLAVALLPVVFGRGRVRVLSAALIVGSVATWSAAVWLNPNPAFLYAHYEPGHVRLLASTRYLVVPSMLITASLVLSASFLLRRGRRGVFASGAIVGVLLLAMIGSYRLDGFNRTGGPQWSDEVSTRSEVCAEGARDFTVPIFPATWSVDVPCSLP
jgi:hypothetical protein